MSVVVPTYQRVEDLERCLTALQAQTRAPDEIVVVVQRTDHATLRYLDRSEARFRVRRREVERPGLVEALNAGFAVATGDIVAFTDDDAAPLADWLSRIEAHFASDARVGAVGGRDRLHAPGVDQRRRRRVGRVQWFGRQIQNHHAGIGPARAVDFLKGCNMSFRRSAVGQLRFDDRLRGTGAQVYVDTGYCLALRRAGWRLIYDPAVTVDHYPGHRADLDQRDRTFNAAVVRNSVHNETLTLFEHLGPLRRLVFLGYTLAVGSAGSPGLAQLPRLALRGERRILERWIATLSGRALGVQTFLGST
jgi:GT2 family glycosyltransferase